MPAHDTPSAPPPPIGPAGPPEALDRIRRFCLRASVAGVLISLGVHIALWIVAMLVRVPYSNADAGGQGESVVQFAVMDQVTLAAPDDAPAARTPAAAESPSTPIESLAQLVGADADPLADVDIRLESQATPAAASGASPDTSAFGATGAGSGASFFGLEAQGRRFIYIIDVSGSMDGNAFDERSRIEVTRGELSRSISGLLETSEFSVLLFAADSGALYPRAWIAATEHNKIDARSRIGRLSTGDVAQYGVRNTGGTDPRRAFEQAFRLRPLADAIYLMTDGEFAQDVPEFIENLNRRARLPIHCILFTDPDSNVRQSAEPRLREIASQSGGKYTLIGGP